MRLYNCLFFIYHCLLRGASYVVPRAKQLIEGQQWSEKEIARWVTQRKMGQKLVWMHCASLGEFEQGRPVLEKLRSDFSEVLILLSFYSPSGFEVRKNTPLADLVVYLGPDKPKTMEHWVGLVSPTLFITVKYEVWPNLFTELEKQRVPIYLLSAIFRAQHRYFGRFRRFWTPILSKVTLFFVQNEHSKQLLNSVGIDQVMVIGDTRYDRVHTIAQNNKVLEEYEQWIGKKPVIILGSSYTVEESILRAIKREWRDHYKLIIAPHHIDEDNVQQILLEWSGDISLASELKTSRAIDVTRPVLLLNTMGELGSLYAKGSLAIIGGGWGKGIHNTLEPAAHGLAVIWGPKDDKFEEASKLVESGGGMRFSRPVEMQRWLLRVLQSPDELKTMGNRARNHVRLHLGATDHFMEVVSKKLRQ